MPDAFDTVKARTTVARTLTCSNAAIFGFHVLQHVSCYEVRLLKRGSLHTSS